MALSSLLRLLTATALVGLASAANSTTNSTTSTFSPAGLSPVATTELLVGFINDTVLLNTPGMNISLGSVQTQPSLGLNTIPAGLNSGQYLALMVDIDTAANTSQLLHWLSPDNSIYNASGTASVFPLGLSNSTPALIPYRNPSPPSGGAAHRYVQYLFAQPSVSFTLPPAYANYSSTNRTLFNVASFAAAASLGSPVAANYMYVANTTTVAASSTAKMTGTASSSSKVVHVITTDVASTRLITGTNGVVSTAVLTVTELLTSTAGVGPAMTAPPMAWQAAAGLVGALAVLV